MVGSTMPIRTIKASPVHDFSDMAFAMVHVESHHRSGRTKPGCKSFMSAGRLGVVRSLRSNC
jgi:hypothetical protein